MPPPRRSRVASGLQAKAGLQPGDVMTDTSGLSWISRLLAETTVTFDSPLPRAECVERLQAELGSWWPLFRRRTVVGSVHANGFVLRKATHCVARVRARGTLLPLPSGTRVVVALGRPRWRQALERLSVVVALVFCGVLVAGLWRSPGAPAWAPLIPAGLLGQTLLQAVRWPRQRSEETRYLTGLLLLLLEGAAAPGSPQPGEQVVDGCP